MGCPGLEPGTNRLKAEYSTIELATRRRNGILFFLFLQLYFQEKKGGPFFSPRSPLAKRGKKYNSYTTKEFSIPTKKTNRIHNPSPEKTVLLFAVHPSGEAKATGTPTTKRKDKAMKANSVN